MSVVSGILAKYRAWKVRKIASPDFQEWASQFPITRPLVRRSADRLYDLVSGFAQTQVLVTCLELGVLQQLYASPQSVADLVKDSDLPEERMLMLCRAAHALGLIRREAEGNFALDDLGAATLGVPGLVDMILHNQTLYRDCRDPVALLKGESDTELSQFWPYVLGTAKDAIPAEQAERFSHLMAVTQATVAHQTLHVAPLQDRKHLLDVGGGFGVFLSHANNAFPHLSLTLFDLPSVTSAAEKHLAAIGKQAAIKVAPGSFVEDPLPPGADAISLIRVLYDHSDETVQALLAKIYHALPPGGLLLISEPMSGGDHPTKSADVYFSLYTMAMKTGRVRSAAEHFTLLKQAGFQAPRLLKTAEAFTTQVIVTRK